MFRLGGNRVERIMLSFLRRPVRHLVFLALETTLASWAYKNRKSLLTRLSRNTEDKPDTSRPLGDRYVGPTADREPSPFEAAMAAEAAPITASVVSHEEIAISHVRIDAVS